MSDKPAEGKRYIVVFLAVHFLISLLLYLNTNLFPEISESGSVFTAYYSLLNGEKVYLFQSYWFFAPAFVAFYIKSIFGGTLMYYFIFQCLLSTLTVYLIYRVVLYISKSNRPALFAAFLCIIYTEYVLLASVFYNQLYDIFFVALFLFLLFPFDESSGAKKTALYALLLVVVIYASMFFRKSLMFIYLLFVILAVLNYKDRKYLLKYFALAVPVFVFLFAFNPYKIFNSAYIDNTETLFWGHTMYGGPGGEAAFLLPGNEERYNLRLKEYMERNNYKEITREAVDNFEKEEIITFIKNKPHRWILLQLRKVFYTFGVVPERDGLLMLFKGKVHMHWTIAVLLLQLPYSLILILFLLSIDLSIKQIYLDRSKRIFYLLGGYLIAGICLFGPYQERYRPVIFVCFFIPVIALNLPRLKSVFAKENRRQLIVKLIFALIFFSVWLYQAYEALFIFHDRYFKVVQ